MDLSRFVEAQQNVYADALAELKAGRKTSHWMWFIFPQIAGLGRSPTAQVYALASLDEARAYLDHPTLGPRLAEAATGALQHRDKSAEAIFGPTDAMKFRSSMTLFEAASDTPGPFTEALDAFYAGARDPATLRILEEMA
ncbi:DUF1810 domain-containing protein [Sphingosinicella sp. LHD-64]|uniref:DUF1810 domain-containing protein n=1 Tax=Sphingosinicella sp. LHD-64 TaxID=3072139 RepID=UPI00280FED71|nr:DUF1810 domain-containing protein [Sphingosinicella sp. LHD-64]MDQ8756085.1 DUF1810 domain-containing protein [Sphingosinicella sp. LHD-64]